jgi:hypothetical protein
VRGWVVIPAAENLHRTGREQLQQIFDNGIGYSGNPASRIFSMYLAISSNRCSGVEIGNTQGRIDLAQARHCLARLPFCATSS